MNLKKIQYHRLLHSKYAEYMQQICSNMQKKKKKMQSIHKFMQMSYFAYI